MAALVLGTCICACPTARALEAPPQGQTGGSGGVPIRPEVPFIIEVHCPACSGGGLIVTIPCQQCRGRGAGCKACASTGKIPYSCPTCLGAGNFVRGGRRVACARCAGKGKLRCLMCAGSGKVQRPNPDKSSKPTVPCLSCNESGYDHGTKCDYCKGLGQLRPNPKLALLANCWYCSGKGHAPPVCHRCKGRGLQGPDNNRGPCQLCYATGRLWRPCRDCTGIGRLPEKP